MGGTNACTEHNDLMVPLMIMECLTLAWALFVLVKFIYEGILKLKGGKCGFNAVASTLVLGTATMIFIPLWLIEVPVMLGQSSYHYQGIANQGFVPCMVIFSMTSLLNMSLMWVQVAGQVQSLKAGSKNLRSRTMIMVISLSAFFTIITIVMAIVAFYMLQCESLFKCSMLFVGRLLLPRSTAVWPPRCCRAADDLTPPLSTFHPLRNLFLLSSGCRRLRVDHCYNLRYRRVQVQNRHANCG